MSTTIYKKVSASSIGNAVAKATPDTPVVVLDFSDSQALATAVATNLEARILRGEIRDVSRLLYYFKCGASTNTLLTAVNLAMSQVTNKYLTALYLSAIPRNTEAWKLAVLSREYFAVTCSVAPADQKTSGTLFAHRVDLWSGCS